MKNISGRKICLFFALFFVFASSSCGQTGSLILESAFGDENSVLKPLNSFAKKSEITKSAFACYKFQNSQKMLIKNHLENGGEALVIRLKFLPDAKEYELLQTMPQMPVKIAFLDSSDFSATGKFTSKNNPAENKITVQGNLINFISAGKENLIDLSIAFGNEVPVPEGFFVFSSVHCVIESVCIAPAMIGYDFSLEIPFYGFSSNGGSIRFAATGFDFSGGNLIFPYKNSSKALMPEFFIKLSNEQSLKSTAEKENFAEFNFGGEKIYIKNVIQSDEFTIPAAALKNPFSGVDLASGSDFVKAVILKENSQKVSQTLDVVDSIKIDPGLILNYPVSSWRNSEYEIFTWDRLSNIIFFDTKSYDVQDKFFRRLAYFVEKAGFKGTLLTNQQLEGKHGYNAHDYSAESMAKFFNKAAELNFTLNDEEILLKKILIQNGFFKADGELVTAVNGGLVSISQESAPWLRVQLLAHEGWHTIFFTDEDYRNFVAAVYYTMDDSARNFLIDYFCSQPSLGYDTNDEYLMVNEFMAYTLQQRYSRVAKYFVDHAKWDSVQRFSPELAAYIIKTNAAAFEDAAVMMNDYIFNKYGIVCGNIALIQR
mgnify:CR=1 FL=1